jgi:hypothetical protein
MRRDRCDGGNRVAGAVDRRRQCFERVLLYNEACPRLGQVLSRLSRGITDKDTGDRAQQGRARCN